MGEAKLEALVELLNDQEIVVVPDNAKKVLVELKTSFGQLLKASLPVNNRMSGCSDFKGSIINPSPRDVCQ